MSFKQTAFRWTAALLLTAGSTVASANNYYYYKYYSQFEYEVTITNITRGQTFTPQMVVTHNPDVQLFELGSPASSELEVLVEAGDTGPATELLSNLPEVSEVKTIPGLLGPGESISTTITTNIFRHPVISMAAMLIPTNDTFVALNSVPLPRRGTISRHLKAYDAGTELNDQNCANMPGPRCGGEGSSAFSETDEGYVYIGNGFHEIGDNDVAGNEILGPLVYDWRNPVAKITIRRIR